MDGFHKPQNRYSHVRGCRLCNDNENDLEYDNNHSKYGILHRSGDVHILHDDYEEAEEVEDRLSSCSTAENNEKQHEQSTFYKSFETEKDDYESQNNSPKKLGQSSSDEFVRKIVDKIYEKMSNNKLADVSSIIDDNNDLSGDNLNDHHHNQFENRFNPPENASLDRSDQNHHQNSPLVHRTLYEELLIASELETSKKLNKIDSIATGISRSPEKTSNIVKGSDSIFSSSLKFQNVTQPSQIAIASVSSKLENDTNNNRINGGVEPKTSSNSNSNGMIMMAKNNSNVADHSNHSSKSSESFEVDW